MTRNKRTFNDILMRAGENNCEALMNKAYLANRLAKRSQGNSRRTAYRVKSRALSTLVRKMPNSIRITTDERLTDMVVVALSWHPTGLHMPIAEIQN